MNLIQGTKIWDVSRITDREKTMIEIFLQENNEIIFLKKYTNKYNYRGY